MKYNPFVPDSVADPSMFAGRAHELHVVKRSLFQTKHGNPPNLLITGERGIGKSSLMHYVHLMASGKISADEENFHFLVVSLDLNRAQSRVDIIVAILRELQSVLNSQDAMKNFTEKASEFLSRLKVMGISYDLPTPDLSPESLFTELVSVLYGIASSGNWDGVAILIDEADCPPSSAHLGALLKSITERLTIRGCRRVIFTLAGQLSTVNNLRKSHESSLRIFTVLDLDPLGQDEQNEVILRGIGLANRESIQKTRICDDAIGRLVELSEGYPYFIQQYAYSSFESDVDYNITVEDVEKGIYSDDGAIQKIGDKFSYRRIFFNEIKSDDYRKLLQYMARSKDPWIARGDMVKFSGVKEKVVDNALSSLKQKNIIHSNERIRGIYRLPTRSFAIWISTVTNGDCEAI